MILSSDQFHSLTVAFRESEAVLYQLNQKNDPERSIIFELSAAVGCLKTILRREIAAEKAKQHEHKPNKRLEIFEKRRLWERHSRVHRQTRGHERRAA